MPPELRSRGAHCARRSSRRGRSARRRVRTMPGRDGPRVRPGDDVLSPPRNRTRRQLYGLRKAAIGHQSIDRGSPEARHADDRRQPEERRNLDVDPIDSSLRVPHGCASFEMPLEHSRRSEDATGCRVSGEIRRRITRERFSACHSDTLADESRPQPPRRASGDLLTCDEVRLETEQTGRCPSSKTARAGDGQMSESFRSRPTSR